MSICNALKGDAGIDIRFLVAEEDIVLPVRAIVVDYVAARNLSELYATVTLNMRSLGA